MNKFDLIEKTADIDTDLLEEAATLKRKPYKGLKIAAILCCIIVALGVTAYATDMFGIRFPDTPKEGSMTIRDDIGNRSSYKTYLLEAFVPDVNREQINGKVQDDLAAIKEYIDINQKDPASKQITDTTPKEAAEYIGYQYLEPVWFPDEACNTVIRIEYNNICIYAYNEDCGTRDNWLMLHSRVSFTIGDQESSGYRGFMWTDEDNHYVINSSNGCECHIVEYRFITGGEAPFNKISGYTIKNGLVYNIDVIFSENNYTKAQSIVREWAEHF